MVVQSGSMSTASAQPEEGKKSGSTISSPALSSIASLSDSPVRQAPIAYLQLQSHPPNGLSDAGVGEEKLAAATVAKNTAPAPRKPRKKREAVEGKIDNKTSTTGDVKKAPAKPRKPRAPRGAALSAAAIKKEQKIALATTSDPAKPPATLQTQIPDTFASSRPTANNSNVPVAYPQLPNGNINEAIPTFHPPGQHIAPSPPRPASGQIYDPVRSSTIGPRPTPPQIPVNVPRIASTPPRPPSNASISPSIASLLEPHSSQPLYNAMVKRENEPTNTSPPQAKRPRLSPPATVVESHTSAPPGIAKPVLQIPILSNNDSSAMDVDSELGSKSMVKPSTAAAKASGASSSAHSPKPAGRKEPAIPIPPGNGLLSSAMLGGGYDGKAPERSAPTVILHVPLDGGINKYVNFARLAEEQYGFDALHPRLAAQRERLARVAAAGAALENAHKNGSTRSADEMSVDLSDGDQEGENSNVDMGGVNGTGNSKHSGGEASDATMAKKPRKRMMKEDMYDKDDPFVDDTELAWEEQAAASKDGFFVYSGPLVPDGEKANVERYKFPNHRTAKDDANNSDCRAEGPPKRGRGRGRGSRGGAMASTRGGAGGGGPSVTKSGQPRKPRMTKAARETMEREKMQRENMAVLAAKPPSFPG